MLAAWFDTVASFLTKASQGNLIDEMLAGYQASFAKNPGLQEKTSWNATATILSAMLDPDIHGELWLSRVALPPCAARRRNRRCEDKFRRFLSKSA